MARPPFTSLLPQFIQDTDTSQAYTIITEALEDQYEKMWGLIQGLFDAVTPAGASSEIKSLLAQTFGITQFNAFPANKQVMLLQAITRFYQSKGTAATLVQFASLLGYQIKVLPLYCSYAYPNIGLASDPLNNNFFAYVPDDLGGSSPAYAVNPDGTLNTALIAARQNDKTWVLSNNYSAGATSIQVDNNLGFFGPNAPVATFAEDTTLYTVTPVDKTHFTISPPLATNVTAGSFVFVFNNKVLYPSSFFDLQVTVPPTVDETTFLQGLSANQSVLSTMIPFRAKIRNIIPQFNSAALFAFVWTDTSGECNQAVDTNPNLVPTVVPNVSGYNSGFFFTGGSYFNIADDITLNNSTYPYITLSVTFRTGSDVSSQQVIYCQGNVNTGFNLYLHDSNVYAGVWNIPTWGPFYSNAGVEPNSTYYAELIINPTNGTFQFVVSGVTAALVTGISSNVPPHLGEMTLALAQNPTQFEFLGVNQGMPYTGYILEVIESNFNPSIIDRILMRNYMTQYYLDLTTPEGFLLREMWHHCGPTNDAVSYLQNYRYFPNYPDDIEYITGPNLITAGAAIGFGTRIRGYLKFPVTGAYTLYIASDGGSQISLSTSQSPLSSSLIASCPPGCPSPTTWNYNASQKSSPITFTAGTKYYFEVLHKAASDNQFLALGYQEGSGIIQPLSFQFLYPYIDTNNYLTISGSVNSVNFNGQPVSTALPIMFNIGAENNINSVQMLFTKYQYNTLSNLSFAVNGHSITLSNTEFAIFSGEYCSIYFPVSVLVSGPNTVTVTNTVGSISTRLENIIFTVQANDPADPTIFASDLALRLKIRTSDPHIFNIPAGAYTSSVSQADANSQAESALQVDIDSLCPGP